MSSEPDVKRRVRRYLEEIGERLDLPSAEKEEVLQNVESHIHDALERRCPGKPSVAELEPPT